MTAVVIGVDGTAVQELLTITLRLELACPMAEYCDRAAGGADTDCDDGVAAHYQQSILTFKCAYRRL